MPVHNALQWVKVTEIAALAAYRWLGHGDKEAADQAAVSAMRDMMNAASIAGTIVIGEGEIDAAPMLYIGERLGRGGDAVDIAVDPVEGTRMTAAGQANAITVLAAAKAGTMLAAPDMYMEKLVTGPQAKGAVHIDRPLMDNVRAVAGKLDKPLDRMTVAVLAKPRHEAIIAELRHHRVSVYEVPDGDVAAALLACYPGSPVDMMYGIGGAPEGVIAAAAVRALGGDMNARLLLRHEAKGDSESARAWSATEARRCQEMGIKSGEALVLEQLISSDEVVFAATGITSGDLMTGVRVDGAHLHTDSLLITGGTGDWHRIQTVHSTNRKPEHERRHINPE